MQPYSGEFKEAVLECVLSGKTRSDGVQSDIAFFK